MAAMLGKLHGDFGNSELEEQAAVRMFKLWEVFLVKCELENVMEESACAETSSFVLGRVNPHSGKSYKNHANFSWLNERFGEDSKGKLKVKLRLRGEKREMEEE